MATSVTEICNNALAMLGDFSITSIDDESFAARICARRWPGVRDMVLRAHPWNCAMKQAQLAASATPPLVKWKFAYPLPTDCLRVAQVFSSAKTIFDNWETAGRNIHTDEDSPIFISYVAREEDTTKYDALLAEALAAKLAAEISYSVTSSTSMLEAMNSLYLSKLSEARGVDAKEGRPDPITATSWVAAKLGGSLRLGGFR